MARACRAGDAAPEIVNAEIEIDDRDSQLRAERSEKGGGRAYKITYRATDLAGNVSVWHGKVTVPHNQKAIAPGGHGRLPGARMNQ